KSYPVVVDRYPRKIYIEPSAVCNLRCGAGLEGGSADFCNPKVILKHRNSKLMSLDTFKRIIDEVYEDLEDLELFNYGETFLNPDAVKMIAYAKEKKDSLFVFSSTNGHYFETEAKRRALIDSGIDRLMFSVDGTDQASYEKYRNGGNFEQVIDAIKALTRMKKEMGRSKPFIEWRYILFNWNDNDEALDRARKMARDIGVDRLTWHITSWPKGAFSKRFAPGTEDHERIKPELYTTPKSNALKTLSDVHVDKVDSVRGTERSDLQALIPRRWANQILVHHEMIHQTDYAAGYPYHAIIDPTNMCTLKCPFCPAGNGGLKQPRGKMSYERFKTAVDLLGPYLFELSLYNWGEPFLNKRIFEMIRYAKQYQIRTGISSNLNHFSREKAEDLVESGLDELIVSVDGISPATYSKYRVGGDFHKVIRNLYEIAQAKKRLGKTTPFVIYQFLVFRHNEHEIPGVEAVGRKAGADQVKVIPAWISDPDWIPDNDRYSRYKNKADSASGDKKRDVEIKKPAQVSCHWLWNSIVINWDGSVHPCCSHHDKALGFGNIFEQPFEEVWNGQRYREARRFVRTRETTCDDNVCFACKIIGQRNFNDRYFKNNPLVETLVKPKAGKSPSCSANPEKLSKKRTASCASQGPGGGNGIDTANPKRANVIATQTLEKLREAERSQQMETAK
ncbi:MAG: radical SAM protein, partial [Planctomycetes bacterium]|nr:radical SAM protein [Planctomycetota bacterium]